MAIYTAGMTGTQFLAALNRKQWYNVLNYGAVGNDSTDNTAALQAVIDEAHTAMGTVYIPAGIYQTNTLTTYDDVQIIGDGVDSVLKSRAAEILIQCNSTAVNIDQTMGLQNLFLDGNDIGTVGFYNSRLSGFQMENVFIRDFTECGMHCHGTLVGAFVNCQFRNNVIGVKLEKDTDIADSAPNLLTFHRCDFYYNTSWAVYWTLGFLTSFDNCNFGGNGTSGNAATGIIYYKGASGIVNKSNIGLCIKDSWFEANYGTLINLIEPTRDMRQLSTMSNCMFIINTPEVDIKVVGVNTINRLILRGCSLQDTAGLLIDGANASVVNDLSEIAGTITQNNSAKYYTMDFTEVI